MNHTTPFIPADKSLPEITLRAIILATILTIILAAANAYLGLKIGTTVSASIPAAVISMSVLRWFKNANVLENSIVQTAASAGESLISGAAFTLPALLALNYWNTFSYSQTLCISLIGGFLGVLFSIPLRKLMLADKNLQFPEGVAIGTVLKASAGETVSMKPLLNGGLIGGLFTFCQSGLQIFGENISYWTTTAAGKTLFGCGIGLAPAVFAAGYIVGIYVAIASLIGLFIAWGICLPIISHSMGLPITGSLYDSAMKIWAMHIRYIGVGTMLVGGIWTFLTLIRPIVLGVRNGLRYRKQNHRATLLRTELDIPSKVVSWVVVVMLVPLVIFLSYSLTKADIGISSSMHLSMLIVSTLICLVFGFILAAVCAYFAGLVGSTSSPISGSTLSALLSTAFIFAFMLKGYLISGDKTVAIHAAAYTIIVAGIVATIGAISNDTMQDMKSGQIIGSTPWKQQVMLIVGIVGAAVIIPEVFKLLFEAYGMAGVMPRPGMDPAQMLAAPQATMMAAVAQGVFGGHLQWNYILTGMAIAVFFVILDEILKRHGKRVPVLAVGMGIYLPFDVATGLALGGLLSYIAQVRAKRALDKDKAANNHQQATMLACGLVAGASLMGVLLAIPFVLMQSSNALDIMPAHFEGVASILGLAAIIYLAAWLYRSTVKK